MEERLNVNRKQLGTTDLMLSPIGLGTVKFGRNQAVKYPQRFEIPDDNHCANLLSLAQELGINTLDTAPAYGLSEERLGHLLKGQREQWVIIGKAGEEFENGESVYNFTPECFEKSLYVSLKQLQTDYIDIFLIHSDGNDLDNLSDDLIATMQDFKNRGFVRAIGASTKTLAGGIKSLEAMDTVMATYTQDYHDEKGVLDKAQELGKGVLLKKVLGSGHNTNIDDAFRFCFDHPATTSAIIGTINPDHLQSNIEAFERI